LPADSCELTAHVLLNTRYSELSTEFQQGFIQQVWAVILWTLLLKEKIMLMTKSQKSITIRQVEPLIFILRGQRVILDHDLAAIYGISTKRLNEQVKRNRDRFPEDFMFQLDSQEKAEVVANCDHLAKLKFAKSLPYAFTEHGAIMAATVLNSPKAIEMSVFVVRAFIKMRETLANNKTLALKLAELENKLTERLNVHERAIVHVLGEVRKLMASAEQPPDPPKRKIGFEVKEKKAAYQVTKKGAGH
jgi:hypothetical protein